MLQPLRDLVGEHQWWMRATKQKRCQEWVQAVRADHCCLGSADQNVQNNWWEDPTGETRSQLHISGFRCSPAVTGSSLPCCHGVGFHPLLSKVQSSFAPFVLPGNVVLISPSFLFPKLIPPHRPFCIPFHCLLLSKVLNSWIIADLTLLADASSPISHLNNFKWKFSGALATFNFWS